mmetsp:Transcript_42475/g.49632  ORF Transcript_42475/g.49632 Transcript_42475/m.49632 type:complete len:243 (+) Transcript_42475:89-817(+)
MRYFCLGAILLHLFPLFLANVDAFVSPLNCRTVFGAKIGFFNLRSKSKVNKYSLSQEAPQIDLASNSCSSLSLSPDNLEVIAPSYELAIGTLALGSAFGLPNSPLKSKLSAYLGGIPLLLFGLFIAFQTTNLRFTLDDTNFNLVKTDMSSSGENVVVGGENSWKYSSFVNYDFFPSRSVPILVYFKETQTPEEMWNVGPGEKANSPEAIAKGAKPGQVHFFPAIGNVEDLAKGFEKHNCAKI